MGAALGDVVVLDLSHALAAGTGFIEERHGEPGRAGQKARPLRRLRGGDDGLEELPCAAEREGGLQL